MDDNTPDERKVRAARNQALFRTVNERLKELEDETASSETLVVACECADRSCAEILEIHREEYEAVRANARHFAVLPGHVDPQVEDVVREWGGYTVVEKTSVAGEIGEVTAER